MPREIIITAEYFKQYRRRLGFATQAGVKNFFGAKDIVPGVDFDYVQYLNDRLYEIIDRINDALVDSIKVDNVDTFKREHVDRVFEIIKDNNILPVLNNQGRRPEDVYFSWMRGYVISNLFLRALESIFGVDASTIELIGDDDLRSVETFKRTPKADLEINLGERGRIRIEMQSGFTGINDIKQHKVLEAKRVFNDMGVHTLAVHFDLYNGQAAFVMLDDVSEDDVNWITRQQMEGQTVFNIDQNKFIWKITEDPIRYADIIFE